MHFAKRFAVPVGIALFFLWAAQTTTAHMDAARVSLSQLYLGADVVVIAGIEVVEERRFLLDGKPTIYEVVSAHVLSQYKGDGQTTVEFFQDAHGHAHYQPGDTAALFLEIMTAKHQLYEVGNAADVSYVSSQVRNTEHRFAAGQMADYEWILAAYAEPPSALSVEAERRSRKVKEIILRMLSSSSQDMTESGLLDWENAGAGVQFSEDDINYLLSLTRDPAKPLNLRLAILRSMSRNDLVDETAWAYLFEHEEKADLLLVIRSTQGNENRAFMPYIVGLLDHPLGEVVEGAARALGHPDYQGAERALEPLLDSQDIRLNYAAVSALLGINSAQARRLLLDAKSNHANPKVRRIISARMNLLG